ncbi:MAG TPA: hypothetical protein VFB21_07380 [Chthonomonadaceae bacterium]|nr:hypothetical protein [Chthonomonadaceae bacterium]
MHKTRPLSPARWVSIALLGSLLPLALVGCGGGGGALRATGGNGNDTGQQVRATPNGTAIFHVDVKTGQVTVTPLNGAGTDTRNSRAIFTGTAIGFNTSTLLDQPGNVGIKTLNVSLTNHWSLPIGQAPGGTVTGVRVLFSNFTNVSAFSDLRPKTIVSTLAGTGAAGSADGPNSSATFNGPAGAAAAGGGVVYTTDYTGNRIRKIAGGLVSTLAGNGSSGGVNGIGTAASFNAPFGIAVNPVDGALIVVEACGNRIRRVTQDGRVTTIAGTGAAGGTDGYGNTATFNNPAGVAVDKFGVIYVAEVTGQRIRRIQYISYDPKVPTSYLVSTLAGSGSAGNTDGIGTAASFQFPTGLAVADDSTLFVTDAGNHSIRRISPAGEVVTIAGTGSPGSADGSGNTATFNSPRGITLVGGALIVGERSGNRLRQLTLKANGAASPSSANSWQVSTLAGTGASGSADGTGDVAMFNQPQLLDSDGGGNLFVPEFASNKIRKVSPASGFFPIGIPTGTAPAEQVQLSNPDGIIPNSAAGPNLPFITYPGVLSPGAVYGNPARNWWFVVPTGVTAFEFTVTVEALTGGLVPPSAGNGAGAPDSLVRTYAGLTSAAGYVDGVAPQARFNLVKYLSLDNAGVIYVTDLNNNAIRRIHGSGRVTTIVGGLGNTGAIVDGPGNIAKVGSIGGLAASPDGLSVYFVDTNQIRRAAIPSYLDPSDPGNWTVTTIAGSAASGNTDGPGDTATFKAPDAMAMDAAGNLYVSQVSGNNIRYLIFKGGAPGVATNWQVTTFAGDVANASGNTDGTGTAARFKSPRGLAVDRNGSVFVADAGNHRVRKITPEGVVTTLAGGVSGDVPAASYVDGAGATARFNFPYGIAVDTSGFVYVGEYSGLHIRRISPAGVVATVAGTGAAGFTDGPGNIATFAGPTGLIVDSSGNVALGDRHAVRIIERQISSGTQ